MSYSPKRLKPIHLEMVSLFFAGESVQDIADKCQYTPQMVSNILNSPDVQEVLAKLNEERLNTIAEVQMVAQLRAPELMQAKINYALHGSDDAVRNRAQSEVLAIAGHVPVHRTIIERQDSVAERYKDKTDDQLRELFGVEPREATGPDGRPLQ